jgi:hypothetical protein
MHPTETGNMEGSAHLQAQAEQRIYHVQRTDHAGNPADPRLLAVGSDRFSPLKAHIMPLILMSITLHLSRQVPKWALTMFSTMSCLLQATSDEGDLQKHHVRPAHKFGMH